MNSASVMVACVSDEYTKSENCNLEFRFAHVSLRLPIVKAVVGTGNQWRNHEIGFLGGAYPEVNFQYENEKAFSKLLENVKLALEKSRAERKQKEEKAALANSGDGSSGSLASTDKIAEDTNTAYQELFELTQRRFLKQLVQFCEKMDTAKHYPRLLCIDFVERAKLKVEFRKI